MFSFELRIDKDVEPPRLAGEVRISADRNVYEYFTFGDHEENDYQLRAGYNVLQLKPRQLSLISIPGYIWSADNLYRVNVGEESDLQIEVTLYHRLCGWGNVRPLMRRCRTVYCSKNQTCEAAETREENKDDNPKSHESKNEKLEENKIEYIIYNMQDMICKTKRRMTTPTSGRTTSSRAQTSLIRQSHYSYRHYYKMFDFSYARPPFPGGGG